MELSRRLSRRGIYIGYKNKTKNTHKKFGKLVCDEDVLRKHI
jgi:hypothetical protein